MDWEKKSTRKEQFDFCSEMCVCLVFTVWYCYFSLWLDCKHYVVMSVRWNLQIPPELKRYRSCNYNTRTKITEYSYQLHRYFFLLPQRHEFVASPQQHFIYCLHHTTWRRKFEGIDDYACLGRRWAGLACLKAPENSAIADTRSEEGITVADFFSLQGKWYSMWFIHPQYSSNSLTGFNPLRCRLSAWSRRLRFPSPLCAWENPRSKLPLLWEELSKHMISGAV